MAANSKTPEERLNFLFKKLEELSDDEREACALLDEQLITLQAKRDAAAKEFKAKRKKIEERVHEIVLADVKKSYSGDRFRALYKKPYIKRSWSLDGLDMLEEAAPQVWDKIKEHRHETEVPASVRVELIKTE